MPKICEYQNCHKRASYGLKRGSPLRCNEHRGDMKNASKICKCGKARPNYNKPNEKRAVCCVSCKTDEMIDVNNIRCKCGKAQPNFNEPNEKIPICCSLCKTDTMIDIKNKKCKCGKSQPTFNEPNENIPICCKLCKTATMINIKDKMCKCGKSQPTFNEPNENIPICCSLCKTDTMIDIKNKKCKCGKVQPSFNEPNEKIPICCFSCKTDTMVDIIHKKCPGGISNNQPYKCPYDSQRNPKYKNYCLQCFRHNFPLDPLTFQIRSKTKEIAVRDFINSHFEGFQHDKLLQTGHCDCSIRRRIDHRKLIGNTLLVIETDENQHKSYDQMDEETRYNDLFMAHSGKWIYIRFNPDKYTNEKGVRKNPMIATRLTTLKEEIEKHIKRIQKDENTELIERIYMYYDGCDI